MTTIATVIAVATFVPTAIVPMRQQGTTLASTAATTVTTTVTATATAATTVAVLLGELIITLVPVATVHRRSELRGTLAAVDAGARIPVQSRLRRLEGPFPSLALIRRKRSLSLFAHGQTLRELPHARRVGHLVLRRRRIRERNALHRDLRLHTLPAKVPFRQTLVHADRLLHDGHRTLHLRQLPARYLEAPDGQRRAHRRRDTRTRTTLDHRHVPAPNAAHKSRRQHRDPDDGAFGHLAVPEPIGRDTATRHDDGRDKLARIFH